MKSKGGLQSVHVPVLLQESLKYLKVESGVYVDTTLGGGGHFWAIVDNLHESGGGKVLGFDLDDKAINRVKSSLKNQGWKFKNQSYLKDNVEVTLINDNYSKLSKHLKRLEIKEINGLLADLGVSTDQLEEAQRGFSYMKKGPLDMRMSKELKVSAADLVNGLYKNELVKLFKAHDEWYANRIANAILKERKKKKIKSTKHLLNIIKDAIPYRKRRKAKNSSKADVGPYWKKSAMRVFQALRNQVNSELSSLRNMLPQALESLAAGSRLVIISFHSGEDRIVKNFFRDSEQEGKGKIITDGIVRPGESEIQRNPSSRSARMRVFEKTAHEKKKRKQNKI